MYVYIYGNETKCLYTRDYLSSVKYERFYGKYDITDLEDVRKLFVRLIHIVDLTYLLHFLVSLDIDKKTLRKIIKEEKKYLTLKEKDIKRILDKNTKVSFVEHIRL